MQSINLSTNISNTNKFGSNCVLAQEMMSSNNAKMYSTSLIIFSQLKHVTSVGESWKNDNILLLWYSRSLHVEIKTLDIELVSYYVSEQYFPRSTQIF